MRTFVLGDIHGTYKALKQCFQKAGFDHETDQLIFLGDVCDGWPEVYEATDELLKVKTWYLLSEITMTGHLHGRKPGRFRKYGLPREGKQLLNRTPGMFHQITYIC